MATLPLQSLDKYRDYSAIFIRLIVGPFIIWGVLDNILSWEQMLEFRDFLAAHAVPFPLFAANLSVYVQVVCGLSILLGAFVRLTAIPFIINFVAALLIAHRGDAFRNMFPALMMLATGLFFLLHGAGKASVDALLEERKRG